ncbi:Hypothetical predicted protein [Olea europaea subsp. europaea]|uniref:Photosystem I reaction center subunit II, chloroplastic n=1 Tax=Olea europaea subsp. europaea TaxID=158383 RepID=A0A8S0SJH4_OLEEU|nr:Hypothetical predicted protein [Olea europaea subsp. europaea]
MKDQLFSMTDTDTDPPTSSSLEELTMKMTEVLIESSVPTPTTDFVAEGISEKIDGTRTNEGSETSGKKRKQSFLASFTSPRPPKTSTVAYHSIRAMAEEAPVGFTPLELDPNTPSPIFGGSTGGLLRKPQLEEFYVITMEIGLGKSSVWHFGLG